MQRKSVGIIGYGVVGQAMERMFAPAFDVYPYDPAKRFHDERLAFTSDLVLICVGTPESEDRSASINDVEIAVMEYAKYARSAAPARPCNVCIKSTVPPGTTDKLSVMYRVPLCFSPEYIGEPVNFVPPWQFPDPQNPQQHSWVTVGGPRAEALAVLSFFKRVMATSARYNVCSALDAELAKYIENTYFAMKLAFCSEWAEICSAHGADYDVVRELWLSDPRMEADHTLVHADSPGFGGRCLPKDLSAIIEACLQMGYDPTILKKVRERNDQWREHIVALNGGGGLPVGETQLGGLSRSSGPPRKREATVP